MIAPNLVVGAAVGGAEIYTLAREAAAGLVDPERKPCETACAAWRTRQRGSREFYFNRAVAHVEARHIGEVVPVGPGIVARKPDLHADPPTEERWRHRHIAWRDLGGVGQRQYQRTRFGSHSVQYLGAQNSRRSSQQRAPVEKRSMWRAVPRWIQKLRAFFVNHCDYP
jgi:hypothetical protein